MAPVCPERFDLEFCRYAWRYRIDVLPRRLDRIDASGVPVVRLRLPREAEGQLARCRSARIMSDVALQLAE